MTGRLSPGELPCQGFFLFMGGDPALSTGRSHAPRYFLQHSYPGGGWCDSLGTPTPGFLMSGVLPLSSHNRIHCRSVSYSLAGQGQLFCHTVSPCAGALLKRCAIQHRRLLVPVCGSSSCLLPSGLLLR